MENFLVPHSLEKGIKKMNTLEGQEEGEYGGLADQHVINTSFY